MTLKAGPTKHIYFSFFKTCLRAGYEYLETRVAAKQFIVTRQEIYKLLYALAIDCAKGLPLTKSLFSTVHAYTDKLLALFVKSYCLTRIERGVYKISEDLLIRKSTIFNILES